MAIRTTRQYVDTLGPGDGSIYVTRQYVEVLGKPFGEATEVEATDTIAASDEATSSKVTNVSSTDTLSLGEIVRRIYEVATSDLVTLGDQAIGVLVRVSYDTIALTEEAIVDIEVIRHVSDTLSLTPVASFIAEYTRSVSDTLSLLQDEATVSVIFRRKIYEPLVLTDEVCRVLSASDTFSLVDEAIGDRIILVSDTLSPSDEATSTVEHSRVASDTLDFSETATPGHTTQRDVSDTLSLSDESIGDYCRVADDTLALTDGATYVFVRLIHDELALSDAASFIGVFHQRAWETVVLSDEAHLDREVDVSASDTISLTEQAVLLFEASDDLSLNETAIGVVSRVGYDTLVLSDYADAVRDRVSGSDTLILVTTATYNIARSVKTNDLIPLSELAWPGFHRLYASDELQVEYIDYDPDTYEPIITYTGLQDSASASRIFFEPFDVSDRIYLSDWAECIKINADAIAATASDSLSLIEKARRNRIGNAIDSLVSTDTAEVVAAKLLIENLELTETASFNIIRNSLSASDTLELGETVLWFNQLEDYLCKYHPFVGEGSGNLPDPPAEELDGPIPGITDRFKLVYPAAQPFSDTLVLRAPNLGNRDRLQMNRISRETRGGTLIVFADPMWPKIQTLVLDFSGLSWSEASGLHTFMDTYLGQEIGLLDWERRFWNGVITKLDDPIVQDGKGCRYSVGFQFEGELADYLYSAAESLSLSDAAVGVL